MSSPRSVHRPRGASVPLARFSRLYDVFNDLVIEAEIESRHVREPVLAGEHLAATRDNDLLLLYDRGYPAFWLFALRRQEQRHFCARMSLDFSGEVTDFPVSGKKSDVVLFSPGTEARKQCQVRFYDNRSGFYGGGAVDCKGLSLFLI